MHKDNLTAHLEKSVISNIIQNARASLKEPSRPFTPAEPPRSLFQHDPGARPPSAYPVKTLAKDLEKPQSRGRSSSTTQRDLPKPADVFSVDDSNLDKVLADRPDLAEFLHEYSEDDSLSECRELLEILKLIKQEPLRGSEMVVEELDSLLERLFFCVRDLDALETKPKWAKPEALLLQLTRTFPAFAESPQKLLKVARCVLDSIVDAELLIKVKENGETCSSLAFATVKFIYQYSKEAGNDRAFLDEGVIDVMYNILARIVTSELKDAHYDFLLFVLGILKNTSTFKDTQEKLAELNFVAPLCSLLPSPFSVQKTAKTQKFTQTLVQVTAVIKNLVLHKGCYKQLLLFQVVEKLCAVLRGFLPQQEIILNAVRALSSLSVHKKICQTIMYEEKSLDALVALLQYYSANPYIVSRACYILANIVTLFEGPRATLGRPCIEAVHEYALQEYLCKLSKPAVDVLIKGTRLIANIVLHPEVNTHLDSINKLISTLLTLLSTYSLDQHEELLLNAVACITNLLFYDVPGRNLLEEHDRLKTLAKLSPFLAQTVNEELTIEAVRALGNLTRHLEVCKALWALHIPEVLFLLADSGNPNVMFYTLGVFINLSSLHKESIYSEDAFGFFTGLLESLALSDPQLSIQVGMILSNLCTRSKGVVPWETVAGEETMKKLASLISDLKKACEEIGEEDLLDLASILEGLLEVMPKPFQDCPFPNCGRKFASESELKAHWERRHTD